MSPDHLVFVTRHVPPTRDGVGDYTFHLARRLAAERRVTILTSAGEQAVRDGTFTILPVIRWWNWRGFPMFLRTVAGLSPAVINIQWVPFLWGRWGVSIMLPFAAAWLRCRGCSVVTTVHEPYVLMNSFGRVLYGPLQRLALWSLIMSSRKVIVTSAYWTGMLRPLLSSRMRDVLLLPVGSNIPRVSTGPEEHRRIRASLGLSETDTVLVAFSPTGSGKHVAWLFKMWGAVRTRPATALVIIGRTREEILREVPDLDDDGRVVYTGFLAPEDVSRHLAASDICVAPLTGGMSARRTSVMAALEHGLPVVTTRGMMTEEIFEGSPLVLAPFDDLPAFIEGVRRLLDDPAAAVGLGAESSRFWERHFRWDRIAEALAAHLSELPRGTGGTLSAGPERSISP